MLIEYEDRLNRFDALILRGFYWGLYAWKELEKVIHLGTRKRFSRREEPGEGAFGIADTTGVLNIREGLKPKPDRLPQRLRRESLSLEQRLSEDELQCLIDDYSACGDGVRRVCQY